MGSWRVWATPLTIGAFLLMAVTGILMFFKIATGFNVPAHEWFSWAFLIGAGAHLAANLPSFKQHLKKTKARVIMGFFVIVLAASFLSFGKGEGGLVPTVMSSMASAPIEAVAAIAKKPVSDVLAILAADGLANAREGQSLRELSQGNREKERELLKAILLSK